MSCNLEKAQTASLNQVIRSWGKDKTSFRKPASQGDDSLVS